MFFVDFIDEQCNVICTHEVDVKSSFTARRYVEKVLKCWKGCNEAWVFRNYYGARMFSFCVRR